MNIDLEDDDLRKLVSEAILVSLDSKKRDVLIREAIQCLLIPVKSYTGSDTSPLQDLFNRAVSQMAYEVVESELKDNAKIKANIKELLSKAWEKLVTNPDEVVNSIALVISRAMTGRNY
jgi:hypothetical protein